MLGGQGAEAHGNLDNPSAVANVGVNYVTISSYHSRLSASISLCGPGAASSPRPASLQSLLFPELGFSKARCLLATGGAGGFRLSGLFQAPIMGNIRAEEASGAKNDRGGLLELLDLVVEGDTLVVTHIDRLSRGLTYGLQVIEDLHLRGVEFRSLAEDFDTATANGKLQLTMVLAFSEWWRNSIRERSLAGQHKAREEGRFPGRPTVLTDRQKEYVREELAKGVSQRELARVLEVSRWKIQQVAEGAPGPAV